MAKILITSGPTRQYLDPVRYISNASSGQMGSCLAQASLDLGHEVVIVSGPVNVEYPKKATIIPVVSTEDMLDAAIKAFGQCDGVIAAAAPCDYRPINVAEQKLKKSGNTLELKLIETPDIIATLGNQKRDGQWAVCFALETEDGKSRAIKKLNKKNCDLVVLNGASAINSSENQVDIIDPTGNIVEAVAGPKQLVAKHILAAIEKRLIIA